MVLENMRQAIPMMTCQIHEERWLMPDVLWWTWVISKTVGILDFTVYAMRNEFEPFLLG